MLLSMHCSLWGLWTLCCVLGMCSLLRTHTQRKKVLFILFDPICLKCCDTLHLARRVMQPTSWTSGLQGWTRETLAHRNPSGKDSCNLNHCELEHIQHVLCTCIDFNMLCVVWFAFDILINKGFITTVIRSVCSVLYPTALLYCRFCYCL